VTGMRANAKVVMDKRSAKLPRSEARGNRLQCSSDVSCMRRGSQWTGVQKGDSCAAIVDLSASQLHMCCSWKPSRDESMSIRREI
jgi:hypothetical protein